MDHRGSRYFAVQSTLSMIDQDQLHELARIRGLMERSTRFLSLSGLSGVVAGITALAGAFVARERFEQLAETPSAVAELYASGLLAQGPVGGQGLWWSQVSFLVADGVTVLFVALLGAFYFTWRRSRRTGQGLWDASARRMLIHLFLPLVAGGLFALALILRGAVDLVPSATLLFYGLALLNASKYTLDEIRWLGISEAALGVLAAFRTESGLLFWALGFGVLHIFYGGLMYFRHERATASA